MSAIVLGVPVNRRSASLPSCDMRRAHKKRPGRKRPRVAVPNADCISEIQLFTLPLGSIFR